MLFYAPVKSRELLELVAFYQQDISVLSSIGYDVVVATKLREVRTAQYDAAFCWWWHRALPVVMACRLAGKPVVVTGATDFSIVPPMPAVRGFVRRSLVRLTALLATGSVAISEFEAGDLPRRAKVTVIHPSIASLQSVVPTKSSAPSAAIVAQLNPSSIERKGLLIAIEAAKKVRQSLPTFELHVMGLESPDGLRYLRDRNGLGPEGVRLHGSVSPERKLQLLSSSWFYLQPSSYEGFGLAVAEAMGQGCVPIVSGAGALPELVADVGWVVPRDPSSVATTLLDACRDAINLPERHREALSRAEEFAPSRRTPQMARALEAFGFAPPL